MANRKRDVQILLWVTPEEKKMIRKRMILSKTSNMSVYLRKMAIDGMIVNTDTTYLKAMYQEMHKIGVNINQLAKVANTVGTATPQDIEELKEMVKKIWLTLRSLLQKRCDVYRHCRTVLLAEKDAPDKKAYQKQHQAEYQLHDTTLQELSDLGIKKLPSQEKLQKQLQQLETELAATQKELTQLQADQRTLHIVQSNFSSMLQDADILPELSSENPEQSI